MVRQFCPSRYLILHGLLVIVFTFVAVIGIPFRYDHGNSGRYLLRVLRAADPELFPDDPVVNSLNRFNSLFYLTLAKAYEVTGASPQSVERTIHTLYVISKFLLMVAILSIARSFSDEVWLFVLLGAWASYRQDAPVGGEALFTNEMIHTTVSELLGLTALSFLLRQRYLYFWLLLAFSVLIHPLNTTHLALCVVPPMFLISRPLHRENVMGLILFVFSSLLYLLLMAPPNFSGEEARIFLNAKGTISHISPFSQSAVGWIQMVLTMALALLGLEFTGKPSHKERLIAWSIISGMLLALALSLIAVFTESVRLAQFQPMRVFTWVTFLTYLLLAIVTVKAWRQTPTLGILFIAVFALEILCSLWALPFMLMGTVDLLVRGYLEKRGRDVRFWDKLVTAGIIVTVVAMLLLWRVSTQFSLPIATFLNPLPLGVGVMLLWLVLLRQKQYMWRVALLVAIIAYSLSAGAIHWHRYYDSRAYPQWDASIYKARTHPDWEVVQKWCRERTPKDARFIVAGGYGKFRTRSWRTVIGESMSALAWVDPQEYVRNEEQSQRVLSTYENGYWNLDKLFALANEWGVEYVVVNGPYKPFVKPLFQVGRFSIFQVSKDKLFMDTASMILDR